MRPWTCAACRDVEEPRRGDDVEVPADASWAALSPDWRCPRCDAPRDGVAAQAEGLGNSDSLVRALVAAYEALAPRMRALAVTNPRLRVEAVGFRRWGGGLLGALVTPWSVNAVFFPPPGARTSELGELRRLPSGDYLFHPHALAGLPPLELSSISSAPTALRNQAAAVAFARGVLQAMLAGPAGGRVPTPR